MAIIKNPLTLMKGEEPTLITKSITENGTYDASDDNADGYSQVTVNVSGGGEQSFVARVVKLEGTQFQQMNIAYKIGKYVVISRCARYETGMVWCYLYNLETKQVIHSKQHPHQWVKMTIIDQLGDAYVCTTGDSSSLTDTIYFKWYYNATTDTWTYDDTSDRSGYGYQVVSVYKGKDYGFIRGYNSNYPGGKVLNGNGVISGTSPFATFCYYQGETYDYRFYANTRATLSQTVGTNLPIIKVSKNDEFIERLYVKYDVTNNGINRWVFNGSRYVFGYPTSNSSKYNFVVGDIETGDVISNYSYIPGGSAPSTVFTLSDRFIYIRSGYNLIVKITNGTVTFTSSSNTFTFVSAAQIGEHCLVACSDGVYEVNKDTLAFELVSDLQFSTYTGIVFRALLDNDYSIDRGSTLDKTYIYHGSTGTVEMINDGTTRLATGISGSTPQQVVGVNDVYYWNCYNSWFLYYCSNSKTYYLKYNGTLYGNSYMSFKNSDLTSQAQNWYVGLIDKDGLYEYDTGQTGTQPIIRYSSTTPQDHFSYNGKDYLIYNLSTTYNVLKLDNGVFTLNCSFTGTNITGCNLRASYSGTQQGNYIIFAYRVYGEDNTLITQDVYNTLIFDTVNENFIAMTTSYCVYKQNYNTSLIVYRDLSGNGIHYYNISNGTTVDVGANPSNWQWACCTDDGKIFVRTSTQLMQYDITTSTLTELFTHSNNNNDNNYGRMFKHGNYMACSGYYGIYFYNGTTTVKGASLSVGSSNPPYFVFLNDYTAFIGSHYTSSSSFVNSDRYIKINFYAGTNETLSNGWINKIDSNNALRTRNGSTNTNSMTILILEKITYDNEGVAQSSVTIFSFEPNMSWAYPSYSNGIFKVSDPNNYASMSIDVETATIVATDDSGLRPTNIYGMIFKNSKAVYITDKQNNVTTGVSLGADDGVFVSNAYISGTTNTYNLSTSWGCCSILPSVKGCVVLDWTDMYTMR